MAVSNEKKEELKKRMESLHIDEDDILEKFILGSGSGGQKVNKTHSCVYLKHIPSGIEIKCQQERSRDMNRFLARRELCDKLEEMIYKEKSKKQQEVEKIRRQKRRRSRKQKQKMLEEKKKQSEKKSYRKSPQIEE